MRSYFKFLPPYILTPCFSSLIIAVNQVHVTLNENEKRSGKCKLCFFGIFKKALFVCFAMHVNQGKLDQTFFSSFSFDIWRQIQKCFFLVILSHYVSLRAYPLSPWTKFWELNIFSIVILSIFTSILLIKICFLYQI